MGIYYYGFAFYGIFLTKEQYIAIKDLLPDTYFHSVDYKTTLVACPSGHHELPEVIVLNYRQGSHKIDLEEIQKIQKQLQEWRKRIQLERNRLMSSPNQTCHFGSLEVFNSHDDEKQIDFQSALDAQEVEHVKKAQQKLMDLGLASEVKDQWCIYVGSWSSLE